MLQRKITTAPITPRMKLLQTTNKIEAPMAIATLLPMTSSGILILERGARMVMPCRTLGGSIRG